MTLFKLNSGADFSSCRKYRYALWRIWDESKPLVMFIGLNPSSADESEADPTIKSVARISKHNGFGGFYMMNCFPFVSTDPDKLENSGNFLENVTLLRFVSKRCQEIVFAWGNFQIVRDEGIDVLLRDMFPNAKALALNKNGSPKHPLYCKTQTKFITYENTKNIPMGECERKTSRSRAKANNH